MGGLLQGMHRRALESKIPSPSRFNETNWLKWVYAGPAPLCLARENAWQVEQAVVYVWPAWEHGQGIKPSFEKEGLTSIQMGRRGIRHSILATAC